MITLLVLIVFGGVFAAFALLGPAERGQVCDHGRPGDPKCEHCPLEGAEAVLDGEAGSWRPPELEA